MLVALTTILVLGCKVGPNYRRPVIHPPDVFRGTGVDTPPTDATSLADLKWFEVFKDERLQELIQTALRQNYDLRDAVLRVDAARANLGITRADQFPSIDVSADITTLRRSTNGGFLLPFGFESKRTFGSVFLNLLSFEVDAWGRLRRATEAVRADLLLAEENRKTVVTTLVSDVAAAYFNLLELDMELEIARRTLATREDSLRLTELPQLPSVPPGLPSSLLERRPDIRAAEQNLVAANALIGVAKAAYFPQITLTGFLGSETSQLSDLFTGPARAWQFVPQVIQPIFEGGRIRSNVKLTEAGREIALVQYERTIETAFREVSDALVQHHRVTEIRTQQELLVAALQDRSRLAYMRYRGGVDTLLNALDADRDLFAAELDLARTRRDELQAVVQLYKALGGGWQQ